MGADFLALIPTSDAHVSYSHEYDIKTRLLGLVDEELSKKWEGISLTNMERANLTAGSVMDALGRMMDTIKADDNSHESRVLRGVYYFVNHSDCDGVFPTDECGEIAYALDALNKAECGEDGAIESLIKVFNDAYNGDGEVQIW